MDKEMRDVFEYDKSTKIMKINGAEIFKVKSYEISSFCDWGSLESEKRLLKLEIYVDEINIR